MSRNLGSAFIAHLLIADSTAAFVPSSASAVLLVLSYIFWRRLQATPATPTDRAVGTSFLMETT